MDWKGVDGHRTACVPNAGNDLSKEEGARRLRRSLARRDFIFTVSQIELPADLALQVRRQLGLHTQSQEGFVAAYEHLACASPAWMTVVWGLVRACAAGAPLADLTVMRLHVIGARSYEEGVTDWYQARRWLEQLICPKLARLEVTLVGLFENGERDKNDIKAVQELARESERRDPKLKVHVVKGTWHEAFALQLRAHGGVLDAEVLLNPGFRTQLCEWFPTLAALRDSGVPVVVTGHSSTNHWNTDAVYDLGIPCDVGLLLTVPRERNPFAQVYDRMPGARHPNQMGLFACQIWPQLEKTIVCNGRETRKSLSRQATFKPLSTR